MRLPEKKPGDNGTANDFDPRDGADAEVIDLAQRNAFPAVARPAGKSDALGLVAGIAIVAGLGLVTLWSMNSARVAPPEGIGGQQAPCTARGPVRDSRCAACRDGQALGSILLRRVVGQQMGKLVVVSNVQVIGITTA